MRGVDADALLTLGPQFIAKVDVTSHRHLKAEVTVKAKTLLVDHAAAAAGVSRRTIYNWIAAGKLETIHAKDSTRVVVASLAAATANKRVRVVAAG